MKPLLLALAIPALVVGCRSNDKSTSEAANAAAVSRVADSVHNVPLPDGAKRVVVETRSPDGSSTITSTTTQEASPKPEAKKSAAVRNSSEKDEAVAAATPSKKKKKGWSTRAKGAAIGGAAGAATGAIISKHKVGGAVIGGAVGAGGGYIIGNEIDRNKKKP